MSKLKNTRRVVNPNSPKGLRMRRKQLLAIAERRYLTDAEVKELRRVDYLLAVIPYMGSLLRDMKAEAERYPQYIKEVPEWAKN